MLGGLFFATCTMIVYLIRQLSGEPVDAQHAAVSVALVFLASYAGTGFYVWYMLKVAESEFDRPRPKPTAERKGEPAPRVPVEPPPPPVQESPEFEEKP